ncbi:hypothetical protein Syun_001287 [Stephania yunnanensis]|uniref:Uncharacterized protein n=1 Tax=Stephania yunnanensis TaxID=152371 RepID=A0AAP0Q647_9MAGN
MWLKAGATAMCHAGDGESSNDLYKHMGECTGTNHEEHPKQLRQGERNGWDTVMG